MASTAAEILVHDLPHGRVGMIFELPANFANALIPAFHKTAEQVCLMICMTEMLVVRRRVRPPTTRAVELRGSSFREPAFDKMRTQFAATTVMRAIASPSDWTVCIQPTG